MSEQYRTDADMSTLKVNAEWSNYNPGDAIEGEAGYYYGINAFSTVQDAADAVSASATPEQTVSIADAAYGVTRFTKSAILSGTATFDLTDAEPFMLYTDGVNAAEYEISAGTVIKTRSLSLRAEDADKNHQDGLTVSVNCLGTVDMSETDGAVRDIWVRKNTELTIGETGLVTGVTQISNRGIINLNGTINADSISSNGQLMLAGLEDTDGVMNINGGELNVTGVRTIAGGSAISIAVKDNTTGKGVVNLTNGGRITAAGSEMNIGAMGVLFISDTSSVTAARIQNSGVINLTGSATLDTDVELTDSGKVVFGSQTSAYTGSFAGKIEDKSTEYLTQVQVLNGSLVLESGAEINISKKFFKDIKNGFTLGTTDRNEDDGTQTATVTVKKGASILSPNYFWIGSADGAYETPEEQSGRFKLIVDGGTVDASHNAFTVRNTGAVEIKNGGSLSARDGVIRNTVTVAGEGSSFTFGGNVYGESPSGAANAPAYGTASITVSEKASASFTKLQIGGDGAGRANRRGELIIINATATAETITIKEANENEEARGLISLTKNASLTVTSALVNNGRITLDHTSTLEFAEITNNGTITVDMAGYNNEFSLLMNYTGSASVDYTALIGNWADIGENCTVINNMLFLGKAVLTTLKVNAEWSGFKFGDKVGDGYYYGINAFSDAADALVLATDNNSVAAIELIGANNTANFPDNWYCDIAHTITITSNEATQLTAKLGGSFYQGDGITEGRIILDKNVSLKVEDTALYIGSAYGKPDSILEVNGVLETVSSLNIGELETRQGTGTLQVNAGGKVITGTGISQGNTDFILRGNNTRLILQGTEDNHAVLDTSRSDARLYGGTVTAEYAEWIAGRVSLVKVADYGTEITLNLISSTLSASTVKVINDTDLAAVMNIHNSTLNAKTVTNEGTINVTGTGRINAAVNGNLNFGTEETAVNTTYDVTDHKNGTIHLMNGTLSLTGTQTDKSGINLELGYFTNPGHSTTESTMTIEEGATVYCTQLKIGDGDGGGAVQTLTVNGTIENRIGGCGVYLKAAGVLNVTGKLSASNKFNIQGVATVDGGIVDITNNEANPVQIGTEVEGKRGTLILTNGGTATFQKEVQIGYGDTRNGDLKLFLGSSVTAETITVQAGSTLLMDHTSTLEFAEITNNGTITVDMTGYNNEFSLLMNCTGSASVDYAALIGNWADIGENYTVINNMFFLGQADMTTLKINADWSGVKVGDKVGDGYYYGINAFSDFHTAVKSLAKETANIEFSGNTTLDEAGETIFLNSDHDLTIMSDSLVSIGNCANWGFAISNKEGTTVTINSDMDLGAGPLGIYTFGCDPDFKQSYCNVVINAELVGKQVWAAQDANVTISETGSLSSARGEWVQRVNSSITANGNGDGTTIQLNASWINFYGGKLTLNNTCMTSGKVAFNDYNGEAVYSVTLSLNNSNFKSTENLEINKSASTGLLELTDNSTFTAVNVLLNNTNAVIELTNSTLAVDKAITNSGTITMSGSTLSAGTVTNNGTINVSGASKVSGAVTGGLSIKDGATLTTDGLTGSTDLLIDDGATATLSGNGFNITGSVKGATAYNQAGVKGFDLTIKDADAFSALALYASNGSVNRIVNSHVSLTSALNVNGSGVVELDKDSSMFTGETAQILGTLKSSGTLVANFCRIYAGNTADAAAGQVEIDGGTVTIDRGMTIGTQTRSDDKYNTVASSEEQKIATFTITDATLNFDGFGGEDGSIAIGSESSAGRLLATGSTIEIGKVEPAWLAVSIGKKGLLSLSNTTFSMTSTKAISNEGTITMDATSSITANSITGTGAIAITIDAASLTADRYDLITLTGTGALDTANITVNGNAFSSGTKYGEYTILKDDNDIFLTRQNQTTLYVNSAYTPDNADGHIYGYNAFSNFTDAMNGKAAETTDISLIGDVATADVSSTFDLGGASLNLNSEGGSTVMFNQTNRVINGTLEIAENVTLSAKPDVTGEIVFYVGNAITEDADEIGTAELDKTANVALNGKIDFSTVANYSRTVYLKNGNMTVSETGSIDAYKAVRVRGGELTLNGAGKDQLQLQSQMIELDSLTNMESVLNVNNAKVSLSRHLKDQIDFKTRGNGLLKTFNFTDSTLYVGPTEGDITLQDGTKVNGEYVSTFHAVRSDITATRSVVNHALISLTDNSSLTTETITNSGTLAMSDSAVTAATITNTGSFIVSGASTLKGTVTGGLTAQDAAFSEESAFTADRMTVNGTVSFHAADYNGMSVAKGTGGELKVLGISETAALSLSSIEADSLDLAISVAKGKETGYVTLSGDLTASTLNFTVGSMNLDSDKAYTLVSAANLAAANITVNGASLLEQDGKKLFSAGGKLYELTQTATDVSIKFYNELPIPAIKDTSVTQLDDTVNYQYSISVTAEPGTADTFYRWALTRDELAAADYVGADTVLDLGGNTVQGFYYQVKAVNEYGGEAESIAVYVAVKDITAPVINSLSFAQGEGYAFTITAGATDNFGGEIVYEFRYADNAEMNNAVTISGNTFMLTPADAGKTYYVEVRAKDAAGNSTEWTKATDSWTVNDVTAPVVASDGIEQSVGGYSYTVKATATDNLDTNPKIYYRWATSVEGLESAEIYDISAALETADTVQTFFYQIMSEDASGNKSAWSDAFTVKATDCTAPVFSAAPTLAQGDNYTFTVTAEATDNFGGEIVYEFRYADNAEMNGATVTSDSVFKLNPENAGETCYVEVRAKDAAGNWSAWTKAVPSWTVNDVTAPVVASDGIEQTDGGYSYTVKATATDNLDTNPKIYYRWATSVEGLESAESYDISAALETTDTVQSFFYQIMSEDASGNKSAWSDAFTVKATDCTAPVFSAAPSFAQGEGYLFTVTAEATDNFGGDIVYEFRYADNAEMNGATVTSDAAFTLTPSDAGKTYYVEVRAKDAAGNWSAWTKAAEQAVNDVTAPVLIPGYIAQTVGGYTYTVYASATDNLDANPKIYYRWAETLDGLDGADVRELSAVLETANTVQSFFYQIMSEDASGNRTEWSGAYRVDAVDYTAPVFSTLPAVTQMENAYAFTITANAADNFGGDITYEYRYADNSGMENATVISTPYFLLDENKVGDWYVQVRATDAAGNRSEWTTPVSVFQCADVTAPLLTSWRIDQTAHTYSFTVTATGLDNATAPKDLEFFYRYAATPEELSGDGTGIADALVFTADDAGRNYYYQVRVKDAAGNFSEWSAASLFTVANNAGSDISNPTDLTPNKVIDPKANIGTTESENIVVNQEVPKSIFSLDNEIASRTTITLSGLTANDKISVTFLDENGKKLKKTTVTVKKDGTAVISDVLTKAGTNFISLESAGKKTDAVVSMEIVNLYFDEPSANSDLFSAAPLEQRVLEPVENDATRLLSDVSGWVGFGDPKDTFVFTSEYSRLLNLQLNEVETKVKITISNAEGKKIKSYTVSEKTKNFEKEILLGSGAYFITVESGDKGKGKKNGNFSISALETVFDKATGDTSLKPASMDLNNPNTGWVGYSDAADYYKFEVASTQSFGFNLTGLENEYTAGKQIKLHLIDMATGKKITLSGVKNNEDMNFATRKDLAAGSYCAVVSTGNEKKYMSNYSLSIASL